MKLKVHLVFGGFAVGNIINMPRKITQIVIQKKKKNRCSIFLDEEFVFGLFQDVVFKYGLKKGDSLTEQQIEEILLSEEKKKAKERALNFLSHRDRSEKEMRTKLKDIGFDEKIIDRVVDDLKKIGLINDDKFALHFANTKMITRPMGEFLLKRELNQKGISDELIEQTVEQVYRERDQLAVAAELACQRKRQLKNIEEAKAKKRVSDLLMRRGFNWDIVSQILEQWDEIGVEESNV